MDNLMPSKVCDEITYLSQNVHGATVKVHPTPYNGCNYLSMGLKLIHISKKGP